MTDAKMHTSDGNRNLALAYQGALIHDRGDMLSLTDMWKAAGADDAKRPANWARKEGADFIGHMRAVLNVPEGHIIAGARGRSGATYAHWQIGLAYAKYLSHEFHAWCNRAIRERMEGRNLPVTIDANAAEMIARVDGICRMLSHKVTEIEKAIPAVIAQIVPAMISEAVMSQQYGIVQGCTAGKVVEMAGIKNRKGIRGIFRLVSGRLNRFHAERSIPVKIGALGSSTAYVFDTKLAREWLEAGGKSTIENYVAEKRGQSTLRLIQP